MMPKEWQESRDEEVIRPLHSPCTKTVIGVRLEW